MKKGVEEQQKWGMYRSMQMQTPASEQRVLIVAGATEVDTRPLVVSSA